MKTESRTYNSIINSLFGIAAAIINIILNFIVRIFIVKALGDEINGLHNLFQNTINVMALMETGICSAMIIHLYKPVKEDNKAEIQALMSFYQKIYLAISIIFIVVGLIVDFFFLDKIITTTIKIREVRIYFFFFALSFFINYLTYYKRSLLYAEQKNRISVMATTVSEIIFRTLAVVIAFLTREYFYFLLCIIAEKFFGNLICIIVVNKNHPYLRSLKGIKLEKEKQKAVFNTIKPLLVNQIASTVQKSANSILISILLGSISIVGYYGNYQLVVNTVELLFSQIGSAFTSSFGNLSTSGDKEKMYAVYSKLRFIIMALTIICMAGFLVCIQPFIEFFFSNTFVLSYRVVVILAISLIAYLLGIPAISVQNAMGLHKKDAFLMIIQAISSVILGYILGKFWGMEGILIGLNIPTIIFTLFAKGLIINKVAFDKSNFSYLKTITIEILKCGIIIAVSVLITMFFSTGILLLDILLRGGVSVITSVALLTLFSIRNPYFKELIGSIKRKIRKIWK